MKTSEQNVDYWLDALISDQMQLVLVQMNGFMAIVRRDEEAVQLWQDSERLWTARVANDREVIKGFTK
jgi:hypothetical protein